MNALPRRTAFAACALLAACALPPYTPTDVHPGDGRDQVLRVMGPPTGVHTMPDGHERLEYNHMPAGRHTFMIDLDAAGRVRSWEQVLDERHFATIQPGMAPEQVRSLLGPPTMTSEFARPRPGILWMYRWETIERCVVFEVAFDRATGRVDETAYPPDPGCPDEWM